MMTLSLWLSILVVSASAAFAIYGKYKKPRFIHYAFKPLTMLLIISLVWEKTVASPSAYGYLILSGLCLSLLGDVFLMLPGSKTKQGLLAFFIAHILYIAALSRGIQAISFEVFVPILIFAGAVYLYLYGRLGKMRILVLIYMIALCLMAWLAVNRYAEAHDQAGLFALCGGLLFLFSDSVWAVNKFRKSFWLAEILILGTYFAAQLAFALSV